MKNKKLIIVTDLDGSLLDHHDYSYHAANEALTSIKDNDIPLILASSKTRFEMVPLWQELGLNDPFIFENGSGIAIPSNKRTNLEHKIIPFASERDALLQVLHQLRADSNYQFKGFHDMKIAEIMQHTGLSEAKAKLAKQREFTEPLLWQDSEENWNSFCDRLCKRELTATQGGRFISVGSPCNKG